MAKHVISYDLMRGKDYARLTNELRRVGACRVLLSLWLWNSNNNSKAVADHLLKFIDADDKLVVIETTGDAAWTRTLSVDEAKCINSI